ncbi:MAG: hypothetical protein HEP71_09835 [Roseivirga sp.]|nr:hypothetical protein [Roseivirga sp.]
MVDEKQRQKLIDEIGKIRDQSIIDDIYRLLAVNFDDQIYITNEEQQHAVREGRTQINKGLGLSEEAANDEIDQWLSE